jgi:hypothetical protein
MEESARTMDTKHKYSTEHIVVSLLWQYDIRIYFVNIFTEVCSVLHILTWRWGGLRVLACRKTRQHRISIPAHRHMSQVKFSHAGYAINRSVTKQNPMLRNMIYQVYDKREGFKFVSFCYMFPIYLPSKQLTLLPQLSHT